MDEPTLQMIDTHCHLHRAEFDADRPAVLERARSAGVVAFVDPATDFASNRAVVELAHRDDRIHAAVGVHPHHAEELTDPAFGQLRSLAADERVAAIGEIGLDYFKEFSPRPAQKEALRKQLGLARELGKPVIIHCRGAERPGGSGPDRMGEAYRDLFAILREELKPPIRGLLHCFSGGLPEAVEGMEMGLYLSFAGNLTFSSARALRAVRG